MAKAIVAVPGSKPSHKEIQIGILAKEKITILGDNRIRLYPFVKIRQKLSKGLESGRVKGIVGDFICLLIIPTPAQT